MRRDLWMLFIFRFNAEVRQPGPILLKGAFMAMILSIFHCLWSTSSAPGGIALTVPAAYLVWYVTVTETILLAVPLIHQEVQSDLHAGRIVAALVRPTHYLALLCAQGAAAIAARMPIIGGIGFCTTWALTSTLPPFSASVLTMVALAPVASLTVLVMSICVGLTAAWIRDSLPLYWVFQKAFFVLGGFLIPLSFYPGWFAKVASLLPFSSAAYGCAQGVLGAPLAALGQNAILLLFWLATVTAGAAALHRRYIRRVLREGL